ncbi:MAG: DUF839 domain-containing protein [Gammaproteobacteria bacterium]|nr:DUF839 domain-containing protein [Gammaproteobacteria bacterium]
MKRTSIALAVAVALSAGIAQAGTLRFSEVPVPSDDASKREVTASPSVRIDGRTHRIGYNTLLRSGDQVGNSALAWGTLVDVDGVPLHDDAGAPVISVYPDHSSLITGDDGRLYSITQFEDSIGAIYLTGLRQGRDGRLLPTRTRPLDLSGVNGTWTHCAGMVTPWGTHLGAEEYEPNAADPDILSNRYFSPVAAYFGEDPANIDADTTRLNPYNYGFPVEVKVGDYEHVDVAKHYAMGRAAIELAYVMPDRRTAYISDDGTDVGLYRFVADQPADLSAGYLYAARWRQSDDAGAGDGVIEWINLGHASDTDIRPFIDARGSFDDIFERDQPGCTSIRTATGQECLTVRDGMEQIASRLETRRFAAMRGATTEWRKMEGITYNPDKHTMYMSMSEIGKGMLDKNDGGNNDIRLQENPCGAVYALELDGNFAATRMHGLIEGRPVAGDPSNSCDLAAIANPDNLTFIPGYDTLIIGEDTGSGHQNDAVWAYDLSKSSLTRIETTPYGSETTSVYFYPNVGGHAYMMSVVQHPYGESDQDKLIQGSGDDRAYVGYIGPFPAMDVQSREHEHRGRDEHHRHDEHHEHQGRRRR